MSGDIETRLGADRLDGALEEIERLEAARQAQADVLARLLAERANLLAARADLVKVVEETRQRLAAAEDERANLVAARVDLVKVVEETRQRLAAAEDELAMFRGSRSWRWLAPARSVAGWIRPRRGGGHRA